MVISLLRLVLTLFCGWMLCCQLGLADDGRHEQIKITADFFEMQRRPRVSVFRGNVEVRQGMVVIEAEQLTVYFDKHKQMTKLEAAGQPAYFRRQAAEKKLRLTAQALTIRYDVLKQEIELIEKAQAKQGEDEFRGPYMLYNFADQTITLAASKLGRKTFPLKKLNATNEDEKNKEARTAE